MSHVVGLGVILGDFLMSKRCQNENNDQRGQEGTEWDSYASIGPLYASSPVFAENILSQKDLDGARPIANRLCALVPFLHKQDKMNEGN